MLEAPKEGERQARVVYLLNELLTLMEWKAIVDDEGYGLIVGAPGYVAQMRAACQIVAGGGARVH